MKFILITSLMLSAALPSFASSNMKDCDASLSDEAYDARRAYADQDWSDILDLVEAESAIEAMRETRSRSTYEINGFTNILEDNRNELILRMGFEDYESAYKAAVKLRLKNHI